MIPKSVYDLIERNPHSLSSQELKKLREALEGCINRREKKFHMALITVFALIVHLILTIKFIDFSVLFLFTIFGSVSAIIFFGYRAYTNYVSQEVRDLLVYLKSL
jgi:hypothetical protein